MVRVLLFAALIYAALLCAAGCTPFSSEPIPGPDKQASGTMLGTALGATSGAVIGKQFAEMAEGAWIGAAFGAVHGLLSGLGIDLLEEEELRLLEETDELRKKAWAEYMLSQHYARRLELHPNRDIFPADWFFVGDSAKLTAPAEVLVREIGVLTGKRAPSSRIVVSAYVTSKDKESVYAKYLSEKRAEAIANGMVRAGVEPRRLLAQGAILSEPVLVDPRDRPNRYLQAIEITAIDQ
jgi:outer membrane protein OmpA-like peptidoglycan-associated protein